MDERKNESTPTTQEQQEFLVLWEKLTPQQQAAIRQFIEAMIEQ